MVNVMAVIGINTDFLSIPMNGTVANHDGENIFVCFLHMPKGIFASMPITSITKIFAGRGNESY